MMFNITKRTRQEWINSAALFGLVVFASCIYFILNFPHEIVNVVKIFLDDHIPRLPVFAIPYIAFLPWFWGVVVWVWLKNKSFGQLAISIIIVNLIASIVYIMFQTHVPREVITSNDVFSEILKFIYSSDRAYNGFPSLHSGLSAVVATYFVILKNKRAWMFVAMAGLIVISTLFTKQHFVLDAISGVTLGVLVTYIVFRIIPKNTSLQDKSIPS